MAMDLEANLQSYLGGDSTNPDGRDPTERNVSFDYCFNYFQAYRESGNVHELQVPPTCSSVAFIWVSTSRAGV